MCGGSRLDGHRRRNSVDREANPGRILRPEDCDNRAALTAAVETVICLWARDPPDGCAAWRGCSGSVLFCSAKVFRTAPEQRPTHHSGIGPAYCPSASVLVCRRSNALGRVAPMSATLIVTPERPGNLGEASGSPAFTADALMDERGRRGHPSLTASNLV